MAEGKRIVGTRKAIESRKAILVYWIKRNQSSTYSKKQKQRFDSVLDRVAQSSDLGVSLKSKVRVIISDSYKIWSDGNSGSLHLGYKKKSSGSHSGIIPGDLVPMVKGSGCLVK